MVFVNVFNETSFRFLPRKKIDTILKIIGNDFQLINFVFNIIFVDDKQIIELNQKYLNHNWITDVISFNLSEGENNFGEIYICITQALRQAKEYGVSLTNEILRLAIHGAFHIIGFDDQTYSQQKEMRKLEDYYLGLIKTKKRRNN